MGNGCSGGGVHAGCPTIGAASRCKLRCWCKLRSREDGLDLGQLHAVGAACTHTPVEWQQPAVVSWRAQAQRRRQAATGSSFAPISSGTSALSSASSRMRHRWSTMAVGCTETTCARSAMVVVAAGCKANGGARGGGSASAAAKRRRVRSCAQPCLRADPGSAAPVERIWSAAGVAGDPQLRAPECGLREAALPAFGTGSSAEREERGTRGDGSLEALRRDLMRPERQRRRRGGGCRDDGSTCPCTHSFEPPTIPAAWLRSSTV